MTASVFHLPFTHHQDQAAEITRLETLERRQAERITYRGELGRLIEKRQQEINNLKARLTQ